MGSGLNNFLMDFFVDDGSLLIQIQTLRSNNACTKELIFDKRTGITASREKVLVLSFSESRIIDPIPPPRGWAGEEWGA